MVPQQLLSLQELSQDVVSTFLMQTLYNPQRMVNELQNLYSTVIIPFLSANSKKPKGREDLVSVAKISANGDQEIAEAAVKAVLDAGEDGHVLIEEAQGNQLKVETMEGFVVTSGLRDIGAIGRVFINDRSFQQTKMDKGLVFLYDGTICLLYTSDAA